MTVLVIGSGGYMGRHLMAGLAAEKLPAFGSSSSDGTGIHPGSGLLPEGFVVPAGTSTIVYMAQSPRYRDRTHADHILSVNVVSAVRAAMSGRKAGIQRFIYLSTGTVYAHSFNPLKEKDSVLGCDWYRLSKIQGEEALNMFRDDMNVHVVRPFTVYGPQQTQKLIPNLISSIKFQRAITLQLRQDDLSDSDGLRLSLCHVTDATSVLLHLIKKGGPTCLNIAGEEAASIRTIANVLGEYLEQQPIFQEVDKYRDFDLIADTDLLFEIYPKRFWSLREGLKHVVENSI